MVEISERIRSQLGIGTSPTPAPVGDVMTPADDEPISLD
jgi:hypothetical protein